MMNSILDIVKQFQTEFILSGSELYDLNDKHGLLDDVCNELNDIEDRHPERKGNTKEKRLKRKGALIGLLLQALVLDQFIQRGVPATKNETTCDKNLPDELKQWWYDIALPTYLAFIDTKVISHYNCFQDELNLWISAFAPGGQFAFCADQTLKHDTLYFLMMNVENIIDVEEFSDCKFKITFFWFVRAKEFYAVDSVTRKYPTKPNNPLRYQFDKEKHKGLYIKFDEIEK